MRWCLVVLACALAMEAEASACKWRGYEQFESTTPRFNDVPGRFAVSGAFKHISRANPFCIGHGVITLRLENVDAARWGVLVKGRGATPFALRDYPVRILKDEVYLPYKDGWVW